MTGALNDKEINQTYVKVNPHMFFLDHMHFKTNALLFHLIFCRFWVRCHISVDQVGVTTFLSSQGTICNLGAKDNWFFFSFLLKQYIFGGLVFTWENYACSVIYSGAGAHLFRSWATFLNRSIILTPEVWAVCGAICMSLVFFPEKKSSYIFELPKY